MASTQDQDESLVGGRQRRSAATKNKAWSALIGGKHKGDDADEEQQDTSGTTRSTPRSVPRKKQKIEAKPKADSVSPPKPVLGSEKKSPVIPAQAPRLFSSKGSTENGAALGKTQIAEIEKELNKTYKSNESEGFTDSEDADDSMQDLDYDDEEFLEKPKRAYTKRGTANVRGKAPARGGLKGPTFVSRTANFPQRPMQNMMISRNDPPMNSRFVVRPPTLKYASSAAVGVYDRPVKTILLRKNEVYGNGEGPRERVPMTISSMSSLPNRQHIEDLNKRFGARVIAGDSVQKFNGLIDALVGELKLMAEDRERMVNNHQELVEQMNLSHSTAIDIKDSRIRQLENCVAKLQDQMARLVEDLQTSYSQHESSEKKSDEQQQKDEEE